MLELEKFLEKWDQVEDGREYYTTHDALCIRKAKPGRQAAVREETASHRAPGLTAEVEIEAGALCNMVRGQTA